MATLKGLVVLVVAGDSLDLRRFLSEYPNLRFGARAVTVASVMRDATRGIAFDAVFVTDSARRHKDFAEVVERLAPSMLLSPVHLLLGGDGRDL